MPFCWTLHLKFWSRNDRRCRGTQPQEQATNAERGTRNGICSFLAFLLFRVPSLYFRVRTLEFALPISKLTPDANKRSRCALGGVRVLLGSSEWWRGQGGLENGNRDSIDDRLSRGFFAMHRGEWGLSSAAVGGESLRKLNYVVGGMIMQQ